jgi:chemosensory pili system protein ChpA (sensor histidine kinase/response regulator)
MQFPELLRTFQSELDASLAALPEWLTAFAAREEDPESAQLAVQAYADCMERSSETAALLGLEGLAAFFMYRGEGALTLALEASLDRIMGEADWPALVEQYLQDPGPDCAMPLAEWLMELCAQDEQADTVVCLLAQEIQIPGDLIAEPERHVFEGRDIDITRPQDVDAKVYDAFVSDAPDQAAKTSVLLNRYFSTNDSAAMSEARRIVHTFKGTANIIGITGIGRFAHALEDLLDRLASKPEDKAIPAALKHLCLEATDGLESLVEAHLARQQAPAGTLDLMQRVSDWEYALATDGWETAHQNVVAPAAADIPIGIARNDTDTAPDQSASAMVAAPAEEDTRPTVRIAVETVDALLRATSELAVQVGQLKSQLSSMQTRNVQLAAEHADAQRSVQALQLAVDTHSMRQAAVSGASVDPLELDRYNELSSLARMTAESVDDARAVGQGIGEWITQADSVLAAQAQLQKQIQGMVIGSRMVAAGSIASRLARAVRQTARTAQKEVAFEFEGESVTLDADVLDALAAPLIHILRNAVDHGIEHSTQRGKRSKPQEGHISVRFARVGARVELTVTDDGGGYDFDAIREKALARGLIKNSDTPDNTALTQLTLLPGFSTASRVTETSGRGVGMDVVAESVRKLNGQLHIASLPGAGTQIAIRVPASLAIMHLLIVQTAAGRFAIPSSSIDQALAPGLGTITSNGSGQSLHANGKDFAIQMLAQCMGAQSSTAPEHCAWLLLEVDRNPVAVGIETLLTTRETIVRKPGRMAGHPGLFGATLDINGTVLPVLDLSGLLRHFSNADARSQLTIATKAQRKHVLVVDDSVSVRRSLTQLLEDAGLAVVQARDGLDALGQLNREQISTVITDLEMPEMNGIDLTRNLRARADTASVPVVMITSRSTDKHRDMATAAGVDHYLVKPYTDQALLDLVFRLTNSTEETVLDQAAA